MQIVVWMSFGGRRCRTTEKQKPERESCSASFVPMMKITYLWYRDDASVLWRMDAARIWRILVESRGRPGRFSRDSRVQQEAKRFRCHRRTVSGFTMRRVSFPLCQDRERTNQKTRSDQRSYGRRGCRFKMASCCRRARFSNARSKRNLNVFGIRESSCKMVSIIIAECQASSHETPMNSARTAFWRRTSTCPPSVPVGKRVLDLHTLVVASAAHILG
jgi:hypothetical protein